MKLYTVPANGGTETFMFIGPVSVRTYKIGVVGNNWLVDK